MRRKQILNRRYLWNLSICPYFRTPEFVKPIYNVIWNLVQPPEHRSTHQSSRGSVAIRICTVNMPSLKSASSPKAARVRSTCLDPAAQPAHVSTTRTKTHFSAVWQTGSEVRNGSRHVWMRRSLSKNLKHCGLLVHPSSVNAAAKEASYWHLIIRNTQNSIHVQSVPSQIPANSSGSGGPARYTCAFVLRHHRCDGRSTQKRTKLSRHLRTFLCLS
jgi:hypothetical protein